MSLVRNLTRRARGATRGEEASLPRSCTVKYNPGTINRAKISLPTQLISTTNVDALNAPDIRKGAASSAASSSSDSVHSDSDFSSMDKGFLGSDNSSTSDLSPLTPFTPFSDFESKDFFSSKPTTSGPSLSAEPTPAVPQRAPSHSKKAHVELSKKLSIKRSMSPPPMTITESTASRDTMAMFSPPSPSQESAAPSEQPSHPFSQELAKVDEVAEGFGSSLVLDEEEQEMMSKGLRKFTVHDYVAELTGLTGGVFEDKITLNPWM